MGAMLSDLPLVRFVESMRNGELPPFNLNSEEVARELEW